MTDIVTHLRSYGLTVKTVNGYKTRGTGGSFKPKGVMAHHDASSTASGNTGALNTVTYGRPGLNGPLSQFFLARNGDVYVVALGRANHAGLGGPHKSVPKDYGNTYFYGIEAANNGTGEKWGEKQYDAYARLCAALLSFCGNKDVSYVIGHKEWAPSRKIDPTFDMGKFRKKVEGYLFPSKPTVRLSNLRPGKTNLDTLEVKLALLKKGIGKGSLVTKGPTRGTFGLGTKAAYRQWQLRLGYKGADADGIPGKSSLEELGFIVL